MNGFQGRGCWADVHRTYNAVLRLSTNNEFLEAPDASVRITDGEPLSTPN